MPLVTPFWFKQRQAKAEPAGTDLYRLSGPNLLEGVIGIRQGGNGRWVAFVRKEPDGPDIEVTAADFNGTYEAWEAAFELYRRHFVV